MPALDPRLWNLVPTALLLASGCQTAPEIPVDGTETGDTNGDGDSTGDGDGDTTDPSGDGDTGNEPQCDPPCGPYAYCVDGDESPYCYQVPPDPICDEDEDCGVGEWCNTELWSANCELASTIPVCDGPSLVEIPLPDAAQGLTLDLEFVDLDADGTDELVLLRPGELLVVDGGQVVASAPVDAMAEELAPVRANDDAHVDLLLTSSSPNHAALLLGNGDASFAAATTLQLPALLQARAVDWEPGGPQELVALDFDTRVAVLVTGLAQTPLVTELVTEGWWNAELDSVHAVGVDEVVLRRDCSISYQSPEAELGDYSTSGDGPCRAYFGPFGDGSDLRYVMVDEWGADTGLRLFHGDAVYDGPDVLIPGTFADLAGVEGLGFVLTGPSGTRLIEPDRGAPTCVADLDGLPGAERVLAGEFAQNPGDELLLVGQGQLSVWGRPAP